MVLNSVGDVFSRGFESVRESDTLPRCLSLFKKEMPPVLVVWIAKENICERSRGDG